MRDIKKLVALAVFVVVTISAASSFAAYTVTRIGCANAGMNGTCFAYVSPLVTGTSCDGSQIRFGTTAPEVAMYKVALAAFLAGKPLDLNPSGPCIDGYVAVQWLVVNAQ